ncbi:hypothetical protein [Nocardia harenae]|uniref:hypothetical protein n=1 Tax=Nocardia harenae TaxID=358707 RepID=UPI00082A5C9F|nr:hypothetical protein [Nocardia harenae]
MAKQGIEYSPDRSDPQRVRLYDGLPEGISRAEVTFRVAGGLRGSRVVPVSRAEFAQLRTALESGYESPWSAPSRITVSEGQYYVRQAEQRIAERAAEFERRAARIDLDCPWCEQPRRYLGQIGFVTGHTGFMTEAPSELGQLVDKQHAYRCDSCGSLLYFADGVLPHPLPGRKRS